MIALGIRKNDHASLKVCIPTALPMHMRSRIREIRNVETELEHRGKGHAKDLLERICIAADLSDTWLMLNVVPSDATTNYPGLVNLYGGCGFIPFQSEPALLMIRRSARDVMPGHAFMQRTK